MQNSTEWEKEYREKLISLEHAADFVENGSTAFIGWGGCLCNQLTEELGRRAEHLENVTLICGLGAYPHKIYEGTYKNAFRILTFFMGPMERRAFQNGIGDYTSVNFSQVEQFFSETAPPDVVFVQATPPDENGYLNLSFGGVGLSVYPLKYAKKRILQINSKIPFVHGEQNMIHISEVDAVFEQDEEPMTVGNLPISDNVQKISDFILDQIPDGACIQLGVGGIANAIGFGLREKNDLGVHTEMFADSMMELMKNGNVTNKRKGFQPGKSVASFAWGTEGLYKYVDHNEDVYFAPLPVVNNPLVIAQNDDFISINSALTIDLMGQVVADNLNGSQYSATGGQLDFVRGAQLAKNGKSFIAMESTAGKGDKKVSRIVSELAPGSAVTTPRSEVQYVVTEYGCVNLKTLSMKDRVKAMIDLAHPDFRDQLREESVKIFR